MEFKHKPVLLAECIEELNIKKDGTLIGIDRDLEALTAAKRNLKEFKNVKYVHGNHDDINFILEDLRNRSSRWNTTRLGSFFVSTR